MERLLASRMATGQVIRMEEGGADAGLRPVHTDLYAPVLPAPQAVPKPRGVHKPAQAGASLRGGFVAQSQSAELVASRHE